MKHPISRNEPGNTPEAEEEESKMPGVTFKDYGKIILQIDWLEVRDILPPVGQVQIQCCVLIVDAQSGLRAYGVAFCGDTTAVLWSVFADYSVHGDRVYGRDCSSHADRPGLQTSLSTYSGRGGSS